MTSFYRYENRAIDSKTPYALEIRARNEKTFATTLAVYAPFLISDEEARFDGFDLSEICETVLDQTLYVDVTIYSSGRNVDNAFVVSLTHMLEYSSGCDRIELSDSVTSYRFKSRRDAMQFVFDLSLNGDDDV